MDPMKRVLKPLFLASLLTGAATFSMAQEVLPDGQSITPTAAPGAVFSSLNPGLADHPDFTAGQAVTSAVSPDGTTLLVLTSGFNRNNDVSGKVIARDSNEYVFVFDITSGSPVQKQVIQVPNTYSGIAFAPDGAHFYVSGGKDELGPHLYPAGRQLGGRRQSDSARPRSRQRIAPGLEHRSTGGGRSRGYSRRQDCYRRQLRKQLDQLGQYHHRRQERGIGSAARQE